MTMTSHAFRVALDAGPQVVRRRHDGDLAKQRRGEPNLVTPASAPLTPFEMCGDGPRFLRRQLTVAVRRNPSRRMAADHRRSPREEDMRSGAKRSASRRCARCRRDDTVPIEQFSAAAISG